SLLQGPSIRNRCSVFLVHVPPRNSWSTRSKRYTSHRVWAFTTSTWKLSFVRCYVESPILIPVTPTCCLLNGRTVHGSWLPTALPWPEANDQPAVVASSWALPRAPWQPTPGQQ